MVLRLLSHDLGVVRVKKVIICMAVIVLALFPLSLSFSSFDTYAYVAPSEFFNSVHSDSSLVLKPSYDGIYLIQTTYKSFFSPDTVNSPVKLNTSSFVSGGTWNGQNISELDSKYLYDIDVAGFSQTVSYTDEGDYFVYSMITCLPVKGGDDFSVSLGVNTFNVRSYSYSTLYSYIPGGSGCKIVHTEDGTSHPNNPLSYTVKSKNQHFALVLNPDTFSSSGYKGFSRSESVNCTSFSGLTSVCRNADCTDIFTTSYNYTGDISVTLKDSVDNYSFSVYEIFTDGTVTPGFNTGAEPSTTTPPVTTPGSSGGINVDLSEVLEKLIDIRQAIQDKTIEVTVDVSSAVLDKLDSILDTLRKLPADMWDSFKVGLSDMFQIEEDTSKPESPPSESVGSDESSSGSTETTTSSISLEIDQETFDKAMEEVNIDNLGSNIAGPKGAMAFFWFITDKFLDSMGLYTVVYISLFLAFFTWLLRS